ncbi:hypothetical protein B0H66DRAFT_102708 [Apodospora peruviana]|nr:hypothetical protein B0H66DRAFT_102708 [Apodospora peruviana]
MFVKDTIMVLAAVTLVMVTQFGIFNRCDCYTLWGRAPLALPQIFEVKVALMDRIRLEWPLVTFGWIAAELVLCVLVWWWYRDAFGVYTQMDDGTSNIPVAVSSLWRRVFRKRRDSDGALAVHGVEPQGPGPEIPLLRLSGDAKSRSPSAQGDRMNTTGLMQTRPPSDEWGSAARAELNFGR